MQVTSEVDAGSVFSFSLLLGRCDEVHASDSGNIADLQGRTALIVDDNSTNLRILLRQLEGWGVQCASTDTPAQARALVAQGARYDVAVIDMNMPVTDGQQLAAELRNLPAGAALPVVLLASIGGVIECHASDDFAAILTKPVKNRRPAGGAGCCPVRTRDGRCAVARPANECGAQGSAGVRRCPAQPGR